MGVAKRYLIIVLSLCFVSISPLVSKNAKASINSCSVTMSPHSVDQSTVTDFQFQITNTDPSSVNWVRITRPSSNYTILSNESPGWGASTTEEFAYQSDGSLDQGQTMNVTVTAQAGAVQTSPESWIVEVTDNPGMDLFQCSGDTTTSISSQTGDLTPPSIYNISVNNIKRNSVTINWGTSEPATSEVRYGFDEFYGLTSGINGTLKTSHAITLNNLEPGQPYHFQVSSKDSANNEANSGDSTFVTALVDPVETVSPDSLYVAPKAKIAIKFVPTEKIPPTITINTVMDKPFKQAPIITGRVNDNEAVAGIEYSTDGGKNWLLVDQEQGLGTKQSTYSFKPINLDDGNYKIIVRAVDTSGNVGLSDARTLIIDRLPPLVGGSVVSSGPQIFQPNENGVIFSLAGVDQKITFSSVGGAESITINAKKVAGKSEQQVFTLTKQPDTGLWTGVLSFKEPGGYTLNAESIDGANNKTSKVVGTVQVLKPGRILSSENKVLPDAKITLYYLEPSTNVWAVWDGASYDQKNPQVTSPKGEYSLYVPPGKYYLKADAKNHRTLISNVFEVKKQSMPILSELNMKEAKNFNIGKYTVHIPPFSNDTIDLKLPQLSSSQPILAKQLVDRTVPDFALKNLRGETVRPLDYNGRPTLIVFISSWSPPSREQLTSLANLQKNEDINVVPIVSQEGAGKINAILKITGISLEMLTDQDSSAVESFKVQALPTHYFIDRRGVVKKVMVGVLSEDKILETLSGGRGN